MAAALTHVSQQGSLAIVEIAEYSLVATVCGLSIFYNGIHRSKIGFVYMLTFCLLHIVGSACYLSYELQGSAVGYEVVYAITSFIEVAPLLLASLAFSQFTRSTATNHGKGSIILGLLQVLPFAGLVLGIAGGAEYGYNPYTTVGTGATASRPSTATATDLPPDAASTDPSVLSALNYVTGLGAIAPDRSTGQTLLEAASIICVVTVAALIVISAINVSFVNSLRTLAIAVSMPFLVVRVIYTILNAFSDVGTEFQFNLPTLGVQITMRFIMEHAVTILYLFTGMGGLHDSGADGFTDEQAKTASPYEEGGEVDVAHLEQARRRPRNTMLDR